MPNELASETSLYLRQHAENPVNWLPWGNKAWEKARYENKLVLISIGYSACHWCHVMERESFENARIAKIMNDHFICIKVDREERPDVDQIYMDAVQLMTRSGGWPLNCFTLPDGRPVYGGTYFKPNAWVEILTGLKNMLDEQPGELEKYASKLHAGLISLNTITTDHQEIIPDHSDQLMQRWKSYFDTAYGGVSGAPKFPLPNSLDFMLEYGLVKHDDALLEHLNLTLDKMSSFGMYDQIGGGFCRYSTDIQWKAPHFEKMLYDNAQLITTFSNAAKINDNPYYKFIAKDIVKFLDNELKDDQSGLYFAALDADSEGVEGLFYTWASDEFDNVLGDQAVQAKETFGLNEEGLWESRYILSNKHLAILDQEYSEIRNTLLHYRSLRIRPHRDEKILTSWNALVIKSLCEASHLDPSFLTRACQMMKVLLAHTSNYGIKHLINVSGQKNVSFLDDQALTIEALIALYEYTFDIEWIEAALDLLEICFEKYLDTSNQLFWYTPQTDDMLISRKKDMEDSVIPSSNSVMAKNLFRLGILTGREAYVDHSKAMLLLAQSHINHAQPYSNWGILNLWISSPFREIVITGKSANDVRMEFAKIHLPNVIYCGGQNENNLLPLLNNRTDFEKIFVCENRTCKLPVETIEEAISLL